ncbi:MAG: hypothetical protein WAK29_15990 [Terriglobales bacterium]
MKPPYNYVTNQNVSANIYAMKRQYGALILIRRKTMADADPKTGVTSLAIQTVRIQRAVVLQGVVTRDAKQSISLITAQKQMIQGGGFDVGKRTFIIDRKDAPRGYTLQKDDWIVFDNKHYDIDTLTEYEFSTAWVVIGKELRGRVEGMDTYHLTATNALTLADTGTNP